MFEKGKIRDTKTQQNICTGFCKSADILLFLFSFFFCQGVGLVICMVVFAGSILSLGAIVSAKPLENLGYKGWTDDEQINFTSPYASSVYIGWSMASLIALVVTGVLPIVSWFATYRFSLSSALCVAIFTGRVRLFFWTRFLFDL